MYKLFCTNFRLCNQEYYSQENTTLGYFYFTGRVMEFEANLFKFTKHLKY